MKLELEQAEAIVRLRALPEFGVFLGLLGAYGELKNEMLIMRDDINTDLVRGELRALSLVQKAVDDAPKAAQLLSQPKE